VQNINFNFSGKNVLVLGGSKGIGRRVCELFIHYGAKNVYSISRTPSGVNHVKNIICDIKDEKQLLKKFSEIDEFIDILINVAGTNLCETIENISIDEWNRVIDTNLKSFYLSIK